MFIEIYTWGDKYCLKKKELNIKHNSYGCAYLFNPILIEPRYKSYCINGKLHNEFGPAIIWSDGPKIYYLNDKQYKYDKWLKQIKKEK